MQPYYIKMEVFKSHPEAVIPTQGMVGDAGWDLYAIEDTIIKRRETVAVDTGLCLGIPEGYEVQIRSRSGLALKHSVFVLNSPGTVDFTYRGRIKVILHNAGWTSYTVKKGDRIAQMLVKEVITPVFSEIVDGCELGTTERGDKGFGSTDTITSETPIKLRR